MIRPDSSVLRQATALLLFGLVVSLQAVHVHIAYGDDANSEDLVEFLNGTKARGQVKAIRKQDKQFDFAVRIGNRTFDRTYAYDKIHAVTIKGKRYVLNPLPDPASSSGNGKRTRQQVEQLIRDAGAQPPDWFEQTPLDYPRTLELDWPLKPSQPGWKNQVNVGQYRWDIIHPNPGRWKAGLRLLHHIMERHQGQPKLLARDQQAIASMHFELFEDYPRAAYWYRKANVTKGSLSGVLLAECYWRMGNQAMALEMLDSRTLPPQAIKLLGDMGETQKALQLASAFARSDRNVHEANLLAGDACRVAGQSERAIGFYQKVLSAGAARNKEYQQRFEARAKDSIAALQLAAKTDVRKASDGTYRAASEGYNGAVEVEVQIAAGKLTGLTVTRHQEKQFYSALNDTPRKILAKQSVQGIDATSRATITSQAIVNASAKAIARGAP